MPWTSLAVERPQECKESQDEKTSQPQDPFDKDAFFIELYDFEVDCIVGEQSCVLLVVIVDVFLVVWRQIT